MFHEVNQPCPSAILVPATASTIDSIYPSTNHVRRHPAAQLQKVLKSLDAFGQVRPIVVGPNGEIVDGELLHKALRRRGATHVDVVTVADLTRTELSALRLSLNRTALDGHWDEAGLRGVLDQLVEDEFDLELTGFDAAELEGYFNIDLDDAAVRGSVGAEPAQLRAGPIAASGDQWQMNEHVLACEPWMDDNGLADRLLQGRLAATTLVDCTRQHDAGADEAFYSVRNTFRIVQAYSAPVSWLFAFTDWRCSAEVLLAGRACQLSLANLAVWTTRLRSGSSLYADEHELVPIFNSGRSGVSAAPPARTCRRGNVWSHTQEGSSNPPSHCFKPQTLITAILRDVTKRNDVLLDIGIGEPALIAAQRAKRVYRGIEPNPIRVDMAIRRWQSLTGAKAVLRATGEPFDDKAKRHATRLLERHHGV